MTTDLLARITHDPNVMGGRPCIRGQRVTVGTVVGLLASGRSVDDDPEGQGHRVRGIPEAHRGVGAWGRGGATGRVRISAPKRMSIDTIRVFAISKLDWIKQQQTKLREQERETPRDYVDRESHHVWGKRYLLTVSESDQPPSIELKHSRMLLRVRPRTDEDKRRALVEEWYREQLKEAVPPLLARWQPLLSARVERFFVQRMKTKWGSCNHKARTIRLNTELAKKPAECLEYIVVHELVHLLEPTHNARFVALMGRFMPKWQFHRQVLNRLPVRREKWSY